MKKGTLILCDGQHFEGISFGAEHSTAGEVVFNTGMVGYPETLTDPSYYGQILVLTFPLIGNYGVPSQEKVNDLLRNFESDGIKVKALIVADYSPHYSHWNAVQSLSGWLKEENIPALYNIDTRKVTKILREKGTLLGKVVVGDECEFYDPNNKDIVKDVTVREKTIYNEQGEKTVVVIDCGVKNNIIRNFITRDMKVIRVPYNYDFSLEQYDGLCISNGPGDPRQCHTTILNVKKALTQDKPIFGICLGSQILALAAGASTYKLKYGHRSQNQPCVLKGTKRCFITTQNHGFVVDVKTLPAEWEEWFVNANDGTNEGIKHRTKPFMAIQFHPEHCPGPVDTEFLFNEFVEKL